MVDAKPILRVGKIKREGRSTPESVAGHLARSRPTHNADPGRTRDNVWLVGGPDLAPRIEHVLAQARIDPARLRRDATLANDVLLSVSPQWFRPDAPDESGTYDPARLATFRAEAEAFLRERFGKRLVAAVLHVDEATPHVQAIVVPVLRTRDGPGYRLSGKDTFNPASLSALQQAWEDRLRPHGVGERLQGSKARHSTLRRYYSAVEAAPEVPEVVPAPPPPPPLLEGSQGRERRIEAWQQGEAGKARRKLKPLAAAAAKGALYDAERRTNDSLRGALADERATSDRLREDLGRMEASAALDKAELARLRALPLNQVALALGYAGELGKRENAIDLVKRLGGLDFAQATTWLHHAFGPDAAAAAVRENLRATSPAPVRTKAESVKAQHITTQLAALGAPSYRVTVMRQGDGEQVGQNLGKDPDGGPERFYSAEDMLAMIPTLTGHNARGGNIFITPIDGHARHVLVDDLAADDLAALRGRGYEPAVVTETSPGNHQAVLKVDRRLDEHATNEWFKQVNRELGDERITGLTHPFRLAGFQNRKARHEQDGGRFPFVRLVEASGRFCARARAVIEAMAQQLRHPTLG